MGSQKNFDPLFVLPHILFIKKSCEMLNLMRTVTDEWKLQELQVKNTYPWGPTINKVTSIFLNFWPLPFKYQHFFASKVCKYYRLSIYIDFDKFSHFSLNTFSQIHDFVDKYILRHLTRQITQSCRENTLAILLSMVMCLTFLFNHEK